MSEIKNWAIGVNQRILRDDASWQNPVQFIEDETRSGKRKRRLYATQQKKTFSVKMRFSETEYHIFDEWFEHEICSGLYSFNFPAVDSSGKTVSKIYRFTTDGAPQYSNSSGNYVNVSMKWEEM